MIKIYNLSVRSLTSLNINIFLKWVDTIRFYKLLKEIRGTQNVGRFCNAEER